MWNFFFFDIKTWKKFPFYFQIISNFQLGSNCAAAYVMIGTNAISDRYCGGELNPEDGNTEAGSIISK